MKKFILAIALMFLPFGLTNAQSGSAQNKNKTTKTHNKEHQLKGKASYYGNTYTTVRQTANGERFDKNAHTAAHKTLPFGTIVKVINTTNGKSVKVRITDRGPFIPGRVIDVTPKAAKELDMLRAGVIPCEVEIISMPDSKKKQRAKTS